MTPTPHCRGLPFAAFADYASPARELHVYEDETAALCTGCKLERCIIGELHPELRRCALERHLSDHPRVSSKAVEAPDGYMTLDEAARAWGIAKDTLRARCIKGKVPGARKLGEWRTAPWVIPMNDK